MSAANGRNLDALVGLPGPFSVVYADPPWSYHDRRGNDPAWGAMTYATMPTREIAALPVAGIAAPDCALFMWATMPLLPDAFAVLAGWGFDFVTCAFVWVKQNPKAGGIYSGMGHWTNQNAELCLLARRGKPRRVARDVKQVVLAPRGRHSAKPAEVRDRIVRLMGDVPRVELFARERVQGWEAWGNEVEANAPRDLRGDSRVTVHADVGQGGSDAG